MEVILFCGLQAAGKSTFFREHFAETHLLISKDLLRNNAHREKRQQELLHLALQAGHAVVIDNTNPTPETRAPLITIASNYAASVYAYYFITSVKDALERNQQRSGLARVPPVALYSTAARLEPPTYAEGFEKIYHLRIAEQSTKEHPIWEQKELIR
jgi:predicted kinase